MSKREPDFSQQCTVTEQEATGTKGNTNAKRTQEFKSVVWVEVSCPVRL